MSRGRPRLSLCGYHIQSFHDSEDIDRLTVNKTRQKCGRKYRKLHFEIVYPDNVAKRSISFFKEEWHIFIPSPFNISAHFVASGQATFTRTPQRQSRNLSE